MGVLEENGRANRENKSGWKGKNEGRVEEEEVSQGVGVEEKVNWGV